MPILHARYLFSVLAQCHCSLLTSPDNISSISGPPSQLYTCNLTAFVGLRPHVCVLCMTDHISRLGPSTSVWVSVSVVYLYPVCLKSSFQYSREVLCTSVFPNNKKKTRFWENVLRFELSMFEFSFIYLSRN